MHRVVKVMTANRRVGPPKEKMLQKQELKRTAIVLLNGNHNKFELVMRPLSINSPPNPSEAGGKHVATVRGGSRL